MGANLAGWRAPSRGELGAFRHKMPLIPAQAGIRAANAVRFWRRDTRRWRAWPGPRLSGGRGSRDSPHVVVLHLLCALCVVTPVFWFLPFQRRKLRRLGGRGVTQSEGARGAHSSGSSWCAPRLGGLCVRQGEWRMRLAGRPGGSSMDAHAPRTGGCKAAVRTPGQVGPDRPFVGARWVDHARISAVGDWRKSIRQARRASSGLSRTRGTVRDVNSQQRSAGARTKAGAPRWCARTGRTQEWKDL